MQRLRVLIVEDEYLLAHDLAGELAGLGAEIVGFAPTLDKALELATSPAFQADAAVVDIQLRDGLVYPAASALKDRGVAVVFSTARAKCEIPEEFALVPHVSKPCSPSEVMGAIRHEVEWNRLLSGLGSSSRQPTLN